MWGPLPGASALRRACAGIALAALALVAPQAPSVRAQAGADDARAPEPAAAADGPEALAPGPALRAALEAERDGDVDRAVSLFRTVAARHPVVADYADLLLARALLAAGRAEEARDAARAGEERSPSSPVAVDLVTVRGDAEAALGNGAAARVEFERALAAARDPARRAALHARLAESLDAAGDAAGARAQWLVLWRDAPLAPESRGAGARLAALAGSPEGDPRRADDFRARADLLFQAGYTEGALADLDHALAGPLDDATRRSAALQRAQCLFRLRRYADAATAFAALAPDEDALIFRARSVARSGDVNRGVELLDALAADGSARGAAQARWYAGLLLDGEREAERARVRFAAVADQDADGTLVPGALWRLAWGSYRAGDLPAARRELDRLEAAAKDLPTRLQARYWRARTAERAGEAAAGLADHAALATEFPLSYYGWRARQRVPPGEAAAPAATGAPVALGAATFGSAELDRPRILLEAGLDAAAAEETAQILRVAGAAPGRPSLADRVLVARLFADAGDPSRAQTLVVDGFGDDLARGAPPGREEPWRLAWPQAFPESVRPAVDGKGEALRDLVWAIMREESGYRPTVVSPAGARGLLQIMPETGARLARQKGVEGFTADALFRPDVNVLLGAAYLEDLTARFGGRLSAAIGSYNAGPEAVARWLEADSALADDEWVESIPYDQTRGYVKRVLRSLHAYEILYP